MWNGELNRSRAYLIFVLALRFIIRYSILGNHEYGYNVQAQLDYAKINKRYAETDQT